MAIATLDACFDNPKVFSGVVKIRKGMAARLILDSSSMGGVHRWFFHFADAMGKRCPESDPSREALLAALHRIKEMTRAAAAEARHAALARFWMYAAGAAIAVIAVLAFLLGA